MKIRQEDFLHMKDQIFQITQTLEDKQSILDEVRSERKTLQSELSRYITMVKQIQKDFELAQQAETELTKERDQLSQHLTQLKHHDFKNIKEEVDQLREKKGLRPLPSLEQEEAEYMGRYLEQRREQWREDGMQDVTLPNGSSYDNGTGGSNDNSNDRRGSWPSSSSTAAAGPPSSSSNRASGSKTLRNSASSSSLVSASSPTAASSGRDGGRSGRSRHSNPGHSRSNNSSGKSKHESSSRSGSGGHASSRSARLNQSRSQSPSQSSTSANARAERMKKRSRY
ncbi:hypothetical protein BGX27_000855 [Mortierella sp. AM989]|nr:hypothetical protein BGX27_000855 [Mortierella sp. AM989]